MCTPTVTVPRAQALHRQRIVDLGGLRIVDREGLRRRRAGRSSTMAGACERGEAGALGEVLEQEALPVELVGRIDGAGLFQQIERRALRGARGLDHGLVFGGVLVGLEQDLVELLAHRRRAHARGQFPAHSTICAWTCFFLLDGGERLLHDFGGRFLEASLAGAAEVVRRLEEGEQRGGLLGERACR
jgi:hypothetical protein